MEGWAHHFYWPCQGLYNAPRRAKNLPDLIHRGKSEPVYEL